MTQIFGLACVRYDLSLNPAAEVGRTRLSRPARKHMKAATMGELGKVLLQMEDYRNRTTADALEFLILTAARTGEVRFATWEEFHGLDDPRKPAEWHIPAERMKMKLPHAVPLSPQAVAVLKRRGNGLAGLVFAEGDEPMSENTMLFALKKRGWGGKITVHGFRTTFSTEANSRGFNPDAIEAAIAHRSMNAVRAIYNRATYSKERREIMEWWGKECIRRKEVAALL
jgi:integrase